MEAKDPIKRVNEAKAADDQARLRLESLSAKALEVHERMEAVKLDWQSIGLAVGRAQCDREAATAALAAAQNALAHSPPQSDGMPKAPRSEAGCAAADIIGKGTQIAAALVKAEGDPHKAELLRSLEEVLRKLTATDAAQAPPEANVPPTPAGPM